MRLKNSRRRQNSRNRLLKKERNREVTEKSVSDAQYFAENVIHMMGLPEAKVEASNGGSAVDVEVSGERMGLLIGKRRLYA